MSADFTPEKEDYKELPPFKMQVLTNFPYIEADFDALTNYQLLCKVVEYLNMVIHNENEVTEQVTSLYNAYVALQNYVNNYFDNLDVQDEINNKLDSMAQDGSLTTLIKNYVDPIYQAYENTINTRVNEIDTKVDSVASGSPLVASSTAGMTDTTRVYVNTTDGKWYYYDGDSWEIGGTYQSTGLADGSVNYSTLSTDMKFNLKTRIDNKDDETIKGEYDIIQDSTNFINYTVNNDGSIGVSSDIRLTTNELIYMPYGSYIDIGNWDLTNIRITFYWFDKDRTFINAETEPNSSTARLLRPMKLNARYVRLYFFKANGNDISYGDISSNHLLIKIDEKITNPSHLIQGNNLLNTNDLITGYVTTQGQISFQNENYKTSMTPIKATANEPIFIEKFRQFVLYDTNLNTILDSNTTGGTNYVYTPTYSGYLYVSVYANDYTTRMINYGLIKKAFEPYREYLPDYINTQFTNDDTGNILYGKTYVAFGDSFTAGAFSNSTSDDYIFEDGKYQGQYKVYPYYIGNRNNMNVYNLAVSGMTLAHNTNEGHNPDNWLSDSIIAQIPESVDYFTIKIGINDDSGHFSSTLGTINSTDRTTFYGNFNYVMSYLIEHYPQAKIGIIVSNAILDDDLLNATENIAKKYGVSYIDEARDYKVPYLIRCVKKTLISSDIVDQRKTDWYVNAGQETPNTHPNEKCHEYESTFIEDFLRRL